MVAHADEHHHHPKVRPEEWPEEELYGKASAGKLGMWIFLLSDALTFAGFLLAYAILRGGQSFYVASSGTVIEYWRCGQEVIDAGVPCALEPAFGIEFTAGLTFLLICSSVTMVMAYYACVEKSRPQMKLYLGLTILGGGLFLVGQYLEYFGIPGLEFITHGLTNEGLNFGESFYATTFYVITSFHGAHVLTGVIYLSVMYFRVSAGKYDDGNYDHLEMLGLFWHFVDLVWILVFTFIYLIPSPGDHPAFPLGG